MTTFVEPFKTIQDAIISVLDDEGITCYDYHPVDGLMPVPSAYLTPADIAADYERSDQGEIMIGRVDYKLRYYVSLEGDAQVAYQQIASGARSVMAAFASNLLGGEVRSASIERMAIDPVSQQSNGRPMLLLECDITIRPGVYA